MWRRAELVRHKKGQFLINFSRVFFQHARDIEHGVHWCADRDRLE